MDDDADLEDALEGSLVGAEPTAANTLVRTIFKCAALGFSITGFIIYSPKYVYQFFCIPLYRGIELKVKIRSFPFQRHLP